MCIFSGSYRKFLAFFIFLFFTNESSLARSQSKERSRLVGGESSQRIGVTKILDLPDYISLDSPGKIHFEKIHFYKNGLSCYPLEDNKTSHLFRNYFYQNNFSLVSILLPIYDLIGQWLLDQIVNFLASFNQLIYDKSTDLLKNCISDLYFHEINDFGSISFLYQ